MNRWLALVALLGLAGCASVRPQACPAGQDQVRTAQLFLGAKPPAKLSDADLRAFVDREVTPRFPEGVTVVDGGGQWKGSADQLVREAAKVVLIVLPAKGDAIARIETVRTAYRARFKQDTVVVIPQPACVVL